MYSGHPPTVVLAVDAQVVLALALCLALPSFERYICSWREDQLDWNVGGPWPYKIKHSGIALCVILCITLTRDSPSGTYSGDPHSLAW